MGYSLDDNYSATQLPPGDYYYVKWWDGGPISRASNKETRNKSERRKGRRKAQLPFFYLSPYFGDSGNPDLTLFRIFEGMTVFHQKFPKIQAMLGLSPCYGLVKQRALIYIYI